MKNVPARNATRNLAEILTTFNATPSTPGRSWSRRNSLRSRLPFATTNGSATTGTSQQSTTTTAGTTTTAHNCTLTSS